MDMMPTLSFRWLVHPDSRVRVLQQLFVDMGSDLCNEWDKRDPEWRDVPASAAHGRMPTRESPSELPPPPDLRLTKKPVKEPDPPCLCWIEDPPEYICPIHGDIGSSVLPYNPGTYPGQPKPEPTIALCTFCLFEQLKKLPVAQL